ncbi:MAG: hypothetical protein FWG66_02585 [Spirochaetes bacterium]|nr:hypothetical protein [Spirochaetota bacterium]
MNAAVQNLFFPTLGFALNASRNGNGRTTLPVSSSMYVYSHFRHVSGVRAPEGVSGVQLSRLKILDTLIEQFYRVNRTAPEPLASSLTDASDAQVDSLIEQVQRQIQIVQREASTAVAQARYMSPPYAPTGALFSLSA